MKYNINKTIFRTAFILLAVYLGIVLINEGQNPFITKIYGVCDIDTTEGKCLNIFYDESCRITGLECEQEYINAGEIIDPLGNITYELEKNTIFFTTSFTIIFCVLSMAFLFNHHFYNWRKE